MRSCDCGAPPLTWRFGDNPSTWVGKRYSPTRDSAVHVWIGAFMGAETLVLFFRGNLFIVEAFLGTLFLQVERCKIPVVGLTMREPAHLRL